MDDTDNKTREDYLSELRGIRAQIRTQDQEIRVLELVNIANMTAERLTDLEISVLRVQKRKAALSQEYMAKLDAYCDKFPADDEE